LRRGAEFAGISTLDTGHGMAASSWPETGIVEPHQRQNDRLEPSAEW
jgi:hypothetical protein